MKGRSPSDNIACNEANIEVQTENEKLNSDDIIVAATRRAEKISDIKYAIVLFSLVAVVFISNVFCFNLTLVVGSSMEPTFNSGNLIVVNKICPSYSRYSIVVAQTNDEKLVKRIIGMPGDTIQIKDGSVFVNGEKAEDVTDDYIEFAGIAFEELTLKDGEYFLLGDNRNNSLDSRYKDVGVINEEDLRGEICFSLWPIRSFG